MFVCTILVGASAAWSALAPIAVQDTARTTDEVEELVVSVQPWIESLAGWLETGDDPPFEDDTRLRASDPGSSRERRVGSFRVEEQSGPGDEPLGQAALRAALLGNRIDADGLIAKIKVVKSTLVGDRLQLALHLEMHEGDRPAPWQLVARIAVDLEVGGDGGSRIDVCSASSIQRVTSTAPLFVERTAGVFAGAPEAARILGIGSDRWAQRLDDPALSAWFGHQGLAAGDINGDGREDLYVAMPSGLPNMLLVQQADGVVKDIAPDVGAAWLDDTKGVLLVDVDGDSRLDIVSALGHVITIQRNDGVGGFPLVAVCIAPDEAPFYGLSAADIDGDGDLDLFGARYVQTHYADTVPVPFEDARNGPLNHLFLNDNGKFVDVTEELGLAEGGGRFSLQGIFVDFDGDRDEDLYVVNDFGRNQLFVFEDGRFTDEAARYGVEDQGAGMGASWSDFDQDGDLDLYVSNMFSSAGRRIAFQSTFGEGRSEADLAGIRRMSLGNSLFVREGDSFIDRSDDAGVRMGRWSWGAIFCDLNADGYDDLLAPAGFLTGPKPGDL